MGERFRDNGRGVALVTTIKDVSRLTGLSISTISKYINGGNVRGENREKIDLAIRQLNFKVNQAARSLKTNRTMTVGILLPALDVSFFAEMVGDIEKRLFKEGYNAYICSYDHDPAQEIKKLELLLEQPVDGVILVAEHITSELLMAIPALCEGRTPLVLLDRSVEGMAADSVLVDSQSICRFAVDQFLLNGHKRIGVITGPADISTACDRMAGYRQAFSARALPVDESLVKIGDYSLNAGYHLFGELMDMENPPTAVFATNYDTTLGAITAAFERKLNIPQDVSFIGYDDRQLTQIVNPPITIVLQPADQMAAEASALLLRRMRGDREGFPHTTRLKACLLMHESIASI